MKEQIEPSVPNQKPLDLQLPKGYKECVRSSDSFFKFYRLQKIVPEEEWDQFISHLVRDLPSSFRIRQCLPERGRLVNFIKNKYFSEIQKISSTKDDNVKLPEEVKFLPDTFQMEMPRQFVRRQPLLKDFHNFLVDETTIGNISRQELVSMIPPLLLDIKSHHNVLDACASPGSKTMQILEMMHKDSSNPGINNLVEFEMKTVRNILYKIYVIDGLIVANDVENKRCYMLVHQTLKRAPTANIVIVNHDASRLPSIIDKDKKPVLFDRVLCDVICSGDGTLRKSPDMWERWSPLSAINLHRLQFQIARRCIELLAPGGLMAYSTCSFNPMENEAVIAHLLRTFPSQIELVDVRDQLPGLERTQGLSTWKVIGKAMTEFESLAEIPPKEHSYFTPSMFPPSQEELQWMNLDRSFRILPHKHNTGGFFVALFKKLEPKSDNNLNNAVLEDYNLFTSSNKNKKKRNARFKENPFVFLNQDELEKLKEDLNAHYGVAEDSGFSFCNLLGRTENGKKREVYYVNDRLRDFLTYNFDRFHVINAGLAILRNDKKICLSEYRIKQDGLHIIRPHMTKRIVEIDKTDFINIINVSNEQQCIKVQYLSSSHPFSEMGPGSVILRLKIDDGFSKEICAWMGANTINPFICREEKVHLLRMLGVEDSESSNVQRPLPVKKEVIKPN